MYYLGFDIGGSSIKAVLVAERKIIKSQTIDTPDNLARLLAVLTELKEELARGFDLVEIAGVGLAVAGTWDLARENMLNSPNLDFLNNQPLRRLAEERLRLPVKAEHDVYCFLLAEKELGLARTMKNVFYLTLGTGIGGALMINGKIFSGAHGAAGEAGHMIMEISQQLDWEDLAANKFIKKSLGISSIKAEEQARSGDKNIQKVFEEIGRNLGVGLANIINILDPEAIIINGGISSAQKFLEAGIEQGRRLIISPAARQIKILFSQLGREAGALGAALLFENS